MSLYAKADGNGKTRTIPEVINPRVLLAIEKESGPEAARAIIKMAGARLNARTAVLSTTTIFNISNLPEEKYDYIINLRRINDIIKLNDFLDEVNSKLENEGIFIVLCRDQRSEKSKTSEEVSACN